MLAMFVQVVNRLDPLAQCASEAIVALAPERPEADGQPEVSTRISVDEHIYGLEDLPR